MNLIVNQIVVTSIVFHVLLQINVIKINVYQITTMIIFINNADGAMEIV